MVTQEWVNRVINNAELDSPDVIGPPRTEEGAKRDAWTLRYIARMLEVGIEPLHAFETYAAGEHDYESDPEQSADDEMSYWDDDDGGNSGGGA
mgnify:CR=1 FL=1